MAETLVSLVLVAGVIVVALDTVGASTVGRQRTAEHGVGYLLANDLMAEILVQEYEEPDDTPVFGPEGSEKSGTRNDYDDVDDYAEWNSAGPKRKNGADIPGFPGWIRTVAVEWVNPADLATVSFTPTDVKRITVTVSHNDMVMAELVAVRTIGLPPPSEGPIILLVANSAANLTGQESGHVALIESWGYSVQLIAASEDQAAFDAATAEAVAAVVPASVSEVDLGTKLRMATIGVVNGDVNLLDEFGFSSKLVNTDSVDVYIVDNTHYINSPFAEGWVTVYASSQPVFVLNGSISSDLVSLGGVRTGGPMVYISYSALDTGASMYGGGVTLARRVQLPWGQNGFDINSLNADGQTILKRSIEWVANLEQPSEQVPQDPVAPGQ